MSNQSLQTALVTCVPTAGAGYAPTCPPPETLVASATLSEAKLLLHLNADGHKYVSTFDVKPECVDAVRQILATLRGEPFEDVMRAELPGT